MQNMINIATSNNILKPGDTRDFLNQLYGQEAKGCLALWTLQDKRTHWFPGDRFGRAVDRAQWCAETYDVYYGVGLRRKPMGLYERGCEEDVVALPALHLDLDIKDPVHKRRDLPPDREAARRLLDEFPLSPSMIVDSGHGFQVYWLLTEMWRLDTADERFSAKQLRRRLQATMQAIAQRKGWGIDPTFDLARVLRLPGTMNRKATPVPVTLELCDPTRRYRPGDFEPYILAPEQLVTAAQARQAVTLPTQLPVVDVKSLQVSERMRAVIRTGDDPLGPLPYPSRSEAVAAVITALIAAGYDDATIAGVLLDRRYGISGKPRQKGRGWVAQELARMRPKVMDLPAPSGYAAPAVDGVRRFPLQVLPAALARYARETAEAMPVPVDFVAGAMLAVAGAAIGSSREVKIKGSWYESPRLYVALVADTGQKKSPTLNHVLAPIYRLQTALKRRYDQAMANYRREKLQYDLALRQWRDGRRKSTTDGMTAQPPEEPQKPVWRQLYTTDATTEALAVLLRDNPRGLLLVHDELVAWILSQNQYKGGRGADKQFYLSAWSGAPLNIHRKGQDGPLYAPAPFLSVLGGLPPDLLHELKDRHDREDGFVERILFMYPDAVPESWSPLEVSVQAQKAWARTVVRLYTLQPAEGKNGVPTPVVVPLTADAQRLWERFCAALDAERADPWLPPSLKGAWHKLQGYCARLALILHELRVACREVASGPVDEISMRRAWAVIDYLKSHTRRTHRQLHQHPREKRREQRLDLVEGWVKARGGECPVRDLQKNNVAGITKISEANTILAELVDRRRGQIVTKKTLTGKTQRCFVLAGTRASASTRSTPGTREGRLVKARPAPTNGAGAGQTRAQAGARSRLAATEARPLRVLPLAAQPAENGARSSTAAPTQERRAR